MTKTILQRLLPLSLFIAALLAACAPQAAITVYITPTPQAELSPEASPSSVPPTQAATVDSGFTLTSIQTGSTVVPHPTITWMGPVISPGYVLPPSSTPEASATPTTPPTVEGQPSATPAGAPLFPDILPDLDASRIGIQTEANLEQADWDEAMRRVGSDQLRLGWIKLQIPWKDMQPNGPDDISPFFQRITLYLQDANRRQLKVLLSVAKAPAWARSTQDQDGPPDDPQALANFINLMFQQFGPTISAIEIWNEPNLVREWTGTLPFNGAGYMRLFDAGYRAVRAYSSSIQVVTAGLAPTGANPGTVDDRTFFRQMYAAGLGSYRDIAIGIHPYSWANSPEATCCGSEGWDNDPHFFFADNLRDYHQIMLDNGHADLQMWVTEFGWATWENFPGQPSADSQWMLRNDKWDQANFTIRAFQIGQQTPYIGPMFLWNLNFATLAGLVENNDERIAYSIVLPGENGMVDNHSTSLTERPLYWMIYDAVRPDVNLDKYD